MLIHELDAFRFAAYDDVESETWGDRAGELEHLEGFELGEGGESRVLDEGGGKKEKRRVSKTVFLLLLLRLRKEKGKVFCSPSPTIQSLHSSTSAREPS